ncbi:LytTR family transcriptional regulator [Lacihabitans sp. CCS-44]|uniref:LytR/AlgR family response regulator transcription factor n=1 Tax=Lacihabitans sp. CCS-44 TaxID=2487331 RepID=UPI0020CE4FAE|nr:LytTR family DNA-binding domain-containing protein [Lacihabitans sp. CCS-44]MCP9756590.1 LytTR family transcriptional regulator [Lacihabitans sp. CCS-44]
MITQVLKIDRKQSVFSKDVVFLRANINYTEIHLKCGKKYVLAKTLKEFYKEFEQFGFFRINRSIVVNMKYITNTDAQYQSLKLKNQLSLNISRRRRDDFKESLGRLNK